MANILYKGKNLVVNNNYTYLVGEPGVYIPPPEITTWSPSYIDTTYWFDAAVDTSVTRDANGIITQWLDLSGLANNTSQTFGGPAYNFRESISFNGINDYFRVPLLDTAERSIFIVGGGGTVLAPQLSGSGTSGAAFVPTWNVNAGGIAWRRYQGATFYESYIGNTDDPNIAIGSWIFVNPDRLIMVHNGDVKQDLSTGVSWNNQDKRIDTIGRDYGGTDQYYLGEIKEIIVCPSSLDEATRQKVEGYLAHKWNLHGELPVFHPYKLAPPPII